MNDKHYIGRKATSIEQNKVAPAISKVILWVDDNNCYMAGNDTGTVIEQDCPYATQAMANALLASISGYEYKPLRADKATISPLAELGDAVTVDGTYSLLAYQNIYFDPGALVDVAAPGGSEVDHEYQFDGPLASEFERKIAATHSLITKTAEEINLSIEGIEGNVAALSLSLDGISSTVSAIPSTYATITATNTAIDQSASSILATVSATYATGEQVTSAISLAIGEITLETTNYDGYSRLRLYSDGVLISTSAQITLGGEVVFVDNLSDGQTVIAGDNIMTGTIHATEVDVSDEFRIYSDGEYYGRMGCGEGFDGEDDTYGVKLRGTDRDYYLIVTNAGIRMSADADNGGTEFYCSSGRIYASESIIIGSDARIKQDVSADLSRYEPFFLALRPVYYRLSNGKSGRYHTGFVAQDVEAALTEGGLTTQDFAGLVFNSNAKGYSEADPFYGLRYGEFTALNTAMIQRLYQRVADLEAQVVALAAGGGQI